MDFETQLINLFNEKGLSENTIKLYVRNLQKLNDDNKLKSLVFLNDTDSILNKLTKYKENTKRIYLISITSTLGLFKNDKKYKKLYDKYYSLMKNKDEELRLIPTSQLNESQKENWIKWAEVENKFNDLKNKVLINIKNKTIDNKFEKYLLPFMVLGLYVHAENEVRRNSDYQNMFCVFKYDESLPDDKNYLDLTNKKFIFNVFKTSKSKGTQIKDISPNLFKDIILYLEHYPLNNKIKNIKKTKEVVPLLITKDGSPLKHINSITRILNKIFGGNVSSSLLRHIFITDKLGPKIAELEQIADDMGHSLAQQKAYVKDVSSLEK